MKNRKSNCPNSTFNTEVEEEEVEERDDDEDTNAMHTQFIHGRMLDTLFDCSDGKMFLFKRKSPTIRTTLCLYSINMLVQSKDSTSKCSAFMWS